MPPTTVELWIGKEDYLLKRMRREQYANGFEAVIDLKFSDFNQPFTIDPPLDAQGNLLPGWTSSSPEHPFFTVVISKADVDEAVRLLDNSFAEIRI